jgi:hypothetical protein
MIERRWRLSVRQRTYALSIARDRATTTYFILATVHTSGRQGQPMPCCDAGCRPEHQQYRLRATRGQRIKETPPPLQSHPMFRRTVAAFLSLVLFWAGFATQENAVSLVSVSVSAEPAIVYALDNSHQLTDGSVDDHHLDDQPGSASVENLADQPGLFLVSASARAPLLALTRPYPYIAAAFTPGHVEAPQRPPCATSSVA